MSELGDNSGHVITSAQDTSRPWSWVVTAYQKRPVCDSEVWVLYYYYYYYHYYYYYYYYYRSPSSGPR